MGKEKERQSPCARHQSSGWGAQVNASLRLHRRYRRPIEIVTSGISQARKAIFAEYRLGVFPRTLDKVGYQTSRTASLEGLF